MRVSSITPIAAAILLFAPFAQAQERPPTQGETQAETKAESSFVQQALRSGEENVALAKLAAEKTQSDELKQYAQMLVSHHTAVNEQLRLLAQRNGAAPSPRDGMMRQGDQGTTAPPSTAPGAVPTSPKVGELERLTGAEFEKKFLSLIIEAHETSVELYSTESEKGANPAAKKLATEALPKIREHLQQAKSLQEQVFDDDDDDDDDQ